VSVETKRSICRICHAGCPIDVEIDEGVVSHVRGVVEDPLFEGYTCIKGRQIPDQINHPDRLLTALRRAPGGHMEPIASSIALDEIAQRLEAIIDQYGPRAVASYTGTGAYQNAAAVPVARGWHRGLASPSFYTSLTIDQPAKATTPGRIGDWEAGFHNFRDADVIMAIGYNPLVSSYGATGGLQGTNPFTVLRRARARGMKLIVIDPRRTELAAAADLHLQVKPGEDAALLAGIIRIVLDRGMHDSEFCDRWVDQIDTLDRAVDPFTVDVVASRCGLSEAEVVAAAEMFATGPRGTAGTGTGPNMAPHSGLTEHLVSALNIICGRVNREGDEIEAPMFLMPDMPDRAQAVAPRDPRRGAEHRVRGLRGYIGEMLSSVLAEEILEPGEGKVRALIVSGGNPAVAFPDQAKTMRALRDLELLVVVDHRMTPTAAEADYVIAPTLALERADIPQIMDRWFTAAYTNYTDAIVEPNGDVLNEWQVFWGLARRMGTPLPLQGGDLATLDDPTDAVVLDMAYSKARLSVETMRANRGVVHEDLARVAQPADPECDARFTVAPADIVEELAQVAVEQTAAEILDGFDPDRYPYRLVSRRLKASLNSLGPELAVLAAKGTTNPAFMNPDDIADLGAVSGDLVEITSPSGRVVAVVEAAADVKSGVVSMAHSWGDGSGSDDKVRDIGSPTSRLVSTRSGYDKVSGMVVQSAIPVAVVALDPE
jgi:anaerobic selenocysteine-containing dehydrogenase